MNTYQNPIPDIDDKPQSRCVHIVFRFEKPVTQKEAADSINEWFKQNKATPEMILLTGPVGIRYMQIQKRLGDQDSDPNGFGPR